MTWALNFYRSTIGMKVVMAVTGIMLFGFVVGHMVGNLQIFWGEEIIDGYAKTLHDHPTILWPIRGGLLSAMLLHMHAAITLTRRSRAARPMGYKKLRRSNYATLGMRTSAIFVFLFIIYHLAHLTFGFGVEGFEHGHVYSNVKSALSKPLIGVVYIIANGLLGLHLYHGLWSMFRTLGVSSSRYDTLARYFAKGFTFLIVAGNIFIPVGIMAGFLPE